MRRSFLLPLLALALGTACAPSVPVSGGGPAAPAPELTVARRVDHADSLAREAMVVEHPDGTLFVAGYGGPWADTPADRARQRSLWRSRLWRSSDRGATWTRVDVGPDAAGAIGDSDVDLAVAPDGTLYFVTMAFDPGKGEGERISVGVSRDAGATWTWTVLSTHRFDDRPWVEVAPNGTAHVVWNDGRGVNHVASVDRGATWSAPARLADRGGSSHLAVGPGGEVAVRVTPASASGNQFDAGVDLIAVSTDAGVTWRTSPAPGRRAWALPGRDVSLPRWVEPLAWDGAGRLYSLWTDSSGVWLARSLDRGTTWDLWRLAACDAPCYYPYLVARGDGELAATWMVGAGDAVRWRVARMTAAGATAPRVAMSAPLELDAWRADASSATGLRRDTGGEYLAVTFLRDGGLGVATTLQTRQRLGFTWWRLESR